LITINDYALPDTLEEAYNLLNKKRSNTVLGGGAFLRLGSKKIGTAIDLSNLMLDAIEETDEFIEIGAMVTFRQVETDPVLKKFANGILSQAVKNIVGVQLRNIATVGATVYSRYGFSDFITALLALDTKVLLYKRGLMRLDEFLADGAKNDILVKVIINKTGRKAAFNMMRNSQSDYAILNVAVSRLADDWKVIVGARPHRAAIAYEASKYLSSSDLTGESVQQAAIIASKELSFGTNIKGSREYRRKICTVLVKRAVLEVLS